MSGKIGWGSCVDVYVECVCMCIHMGISSPLHIFDNSQARETHVGL